VQGGYTLPAGEWSYPFSAVIPADLPGVMNLREARPRFREASISFTLSACIEKPEWFSRNLRSAQLE